MTKKLNRHALKRRHKSIQKKRCMLSDGGYTSDRKYIETISHCAPSNPRNGGWHYWRRYDLSARRAIAREMTNRAIRARYRNLLSCLEDEDIEALSDALEDIRALRNAEYQKAYDYNWTVW